MSIGKVYIDTMCKAMGDPLKIRCDANDKKHMAVYVDNSYQINKNGVTFIFAHFPEDDTIRLAQVRLTLKLENMNTLTNKMPPHLFGELVKTKKGVELLKKTHYLDSFIADIFNSDCPILKKRASLWCLGHIGRTKRGITLLTQRNLIPELVKMAEQSEHLSMRGTCLYILNLLATTIEGSLELEKCNWKTMITGGNFKICLPKNLSQFFVIKNSPKDIARSIWTQQEEYWIRYNDTIKSMPLNEDQTDMLKKVLELSSSITHNSAMAELKKKINKNGEGLLNDPYLFLSIVLVLTFYKYRPNSRRNIYGIFEKFLNNPNIFTILDNAQNTQNLSLNII